MNCFEVGSGKDVIQQLDHGERDAAAECGSEQAAGLFVATAKPMLSSMSCKTRSVWSHGSAAVAAWHGAGEKDVTAMVTPTLGRRNLVRIEFIGFVLEQIDNYEIT